MKHYTTNKRFCPHEITTKLHSVQIYRQTGDISYVCRKYKISKASLMRWNKQYDGTQESLMPKSHRPHSPHPNAHTKQEIKWIKNYHRRNPKYFLQPSSKVSVTPLDILIFCIVKILSFLFY